MERAFRYAERKYSDSLLALGNIRIGTLHDFRRSEHKAGIADPNEGRKVVAHTIKSFKDGDVGTKDALAMEQFKLFRLEKCSDFEISGPTFAREFDFHDCFIHCTSAVLSRDVMSEFEGADSCAEIMDVDGFYRRLTSTLHSIVPIDYCFIRRVSYSSREESWNGKDWGRHPALIKEPAFSGQHEIRAIWIPRAAAAIRPVVVNDMGLVDFVRAVEIR